MCATPSPSPLRDRDSILGGERGKGMRYSSHFPPYNLNNQTAERRRDGERDRNRERERDGDREDKLSYHAGVPVLGTTAYAAAQVG